MLYAGKARKIVKKRQIDEFEDKAKQKRDKEGRLRSKWKIYKKASRRAIYIAIRSRGKVKAPVLRLTGFYNYGQAQQLHFKRRTLFVDEQVS